MVVGAFPAAKLGALLLKQISKPIANAVKNQAKSSPVFRKYVCMPPAQFYNWCEVKAKMWILNLGKPVNIPVLNEAMAIELGANLLGEGIIFIIAAGIIISEYNRSSNKEYAKEIAKNQEMLDLKNSLTELFIQTEEQAAQLREITRKLGDLETKLGNRRSSNLKKPENTSGSSQSSTPMILNTINYNDQLNSTNSHCRNETPRKFIEKEFQSYNQSSIILKAVNDVENEFWNYPFIETHEDNYLFLSLYYVQNLLRLKP